MDGGYGGGYGYGDVGGIGAGGSVSVMGMGTGLGYSTSTPLVVEHAVRWERSRWSAMRACTPWTATSGRWRASWWIRPTRR